MKTQWKIACWNAGMVEKEFDDFFSKFSDSHKSNYCWTFNLLSVVLLEVQCLHTDHIRRFITAVTRGILLFICSKHEVQVQHSYPMSGMVTNYELRVPVNDKEKHDKFYYV